MTTSAMAEVVTRGLDGLSDGLVEMGQQLAQLIDRMNSWPPVATATSMLHGSLVPGRYQTPDD